MGLSNPIRVELDGQGGFQLVQALRRATAFRELLPGTGEPRWSAIPAGILAPGEGPPLLYRRMVDENMARSDVSVAEMAQLACVCAEGGHRLKQGAEHADEVTRAAIAARQAFRHPHPPRWWALNRDHAWRSGPHQEPARTMASWQVNLARTRPPPAMSHDGQDAHLPKLLQGARAKLPGRRLMAWGFNRQIAGCPPASPKP